MHGEIIIFGANASGRRTQYYTPTLVDLKIDVNNIDEIALIKKGQMRTYVVLKNGKVYVTGTHTSGWDGGHVATENFSEFVLNLNDNEKVKNVVLQGGSSALFLTDKNRIFGYGPGNRLGLGITDGDKLETRYISSLEGKNIIEISAGTDYYVAVGADGKVYGTGSNLYGVLGRWIGIDRTSPNSRYKTAFDWVECPELEL